MIEWMQDKWRIVVPGETMHKFFGDKKPYVVNLMCNSFKAYRNYVYTGRPGIFENLNTDDWESVRRIAIGNRNISLKLSLA